MRLSVEDRADLAAKLLLSLETGPEEGVADDWLEVLAVAHNRRRPLYWQNRMQERAGWVLDPSLESLAADSKY